MKNYPDICAHRDVPENAEGPFVKLLLTNWADARQLYDGIIEKNGEEKSTITSRLIAESSRIGTNH